MIGQSRLGRLGVQSEFSELVKVNMSKWRDRRRPQGPILRVNPFGVSMGTALLNRGMEGARFLNYLNTDLENNHGQIQQEIWGDLLRRPETAEDIGVPYM